MCNVWKFDSKELPALRELSPPEAMNFLEDIIRLGAKSLCISGGEPTLRNDLLKVIKKAKEGQLSVSLITNGTLISPVLAEKLVKSGLDKIVFSIDAPKAGPHDFIRGVTGAWEKAVEGIKYVSHFRDENRGKKLAISVFYIVTRINYELVPEMINLKKELGFDGIEFLPINPKTARTKDLLLTAGDLEKLRRLVPLIASRMKENNLPIQSLESIVALCKNGDAVVKGAPSFPLRKEIMCFSPWQMITVDPFGNIYPCCFACTFQNLPDKHLDKLQEEDTFCLGNLREKSLADIWNGSKSAWFRDKSKQPLAFPFCGICSYDYPSFSKDAFLTGLFVKHRLLLKYLIERYYKGL